jgi:hypothetical protein
MIADDLIATMQVRDERSFHVANFAEAQRVLTTDAEFTRRHPTAYAGACYGGCNYASCRHNVPLVLYCFSSRQRPSACRR